MKKFTRWLKATGITLAVMSALALIVTMLILTRGLLFLLILAGLIFVAAYRAVK